MGRFLRTNWKWLTAVAVTVVLVVGAVAGWNYVRRNFHGEALARLICENFNKNRRGRMEIKSASWRPRALLDYLTGQPTPVTVTGLKLYDVNGKVVVDVPYATALIHLEPLRRNVSLIVEDLEVDGGAVHVEMFPKPEDPTVLELGLVGLFGSRKVTPGPTVLAPDPFTISVKRFHLKNIRVTADIPSADLDLQGVSLEGGYLHYNSPSISTPHRFHLQALPTAEKMWVKFLGQEMNFTRVAFTDGVMDPQEAWELRFAATALENGVTPVEARAHLGSHGVKVDARATNPGQLASRFIPLVDLTDGPRSWANVNIRGTLIKPRVWVQGGDLRWQPPTGAAVENLQGGLFYQRNETHGVVSFEDVSGTVLGAGFQFEGLWDLWSGNMTGRVSGRDLPLHAFVPQQYADMTPRTLNGSATFRWVFPFRDHVEFAWDMTGAGGLLQTMAYQGRLLYSDKRIVLARNQLSSPVLRMKTSGTVGPDGTMALQMDAGAAQLGTLLSRLGLPPLARSGSFAGRIHGDLRDPRLDGYVQAGGLKVAGIDAPSARGHVVADMKRVSVTGASVTVAGGRVRGNASVLLTGRKPHITANAEAQRLQLAGLTGGAAEGQLDGRVKVSGPVDQLSGHVDFDSNRVTVGETPITGITGRLELNRGNIQVSRLRAMVAGVPVTSSGRITAGRDLDLELLFSHLPIGDFTGGVVTGLASMDMRIRGKLSDPELVGDVTLRKTAISGQPVKDSRLSFSTGKEGRVFKGDLFGDVHLDGRYGFAAPAFVLSQVTFTDLDPQALLPPQFLSRAGITTRVTGNGRIGLGGGKAPEAIFAFTKMELGLPVRTGPDRGDRRTEIVRLQNPASVRYEGGVLTVPPLVLVGRGTRLEVSGTHGPEGRDLAAHGDLDLGLVGALAPRGLLPRLEGMVVLDLNATLDDPRNPVSGDIYLAGNRVIVGPEETQLTLRSGRVSMNRRTIQLHQVRVTHDEEELVAGGSIFLDEHLGVSNLSLSFEGAVSASILSLVMGDQLYSANGRAHLKVDVTGNLAAPNILGRLHAQESVRLFFRNGREITLLPGGVIAFSGNTIQLSQVRLAIEDGTIDLDGHFRWAEGRPQDARLAIKIRNLVERSPGTYEVETMGDLQLTSQNEELVLAGTVDLLNARYEKKYDVNLVDRLLTPASRTSESSKSFVESTPWLGALKFDIAVLLTGDIEIDNNFAQTKLEGQVHVGGTLGSPSIGGVVTLAGGTFRIPMLRGNYEIKEGSIDFDRAKLTRHSKDEPYLDVLGEMLFVDRMDNEHVINLRLTGFVSQMKLEWSSSSGLNSAQVLTLLMLNRTPDEVRKGAGGLPDLGGMLEGYVPLNLQLGLTSEAVQVFVDRRFWGEHVVLKGNVEVGFLGQQQQEAQLIFRIHDRVQVMSRVRRRITEDDTTFQEESNDVQTRLELKYKMDFKGSVRDILGF